MRFLLSGLSLIMLTIPASSAERFAGPWKMAELKRPPVSSISTLDPESNVSEVYYENVPLAGKPTRAFAYYAVPRKGQGPYPAMVLVHGGGGKAFREWATLWAGRGYAAIAMDLSGRGPDGKRLPDGGPEQSDDEKFRDFAPGEADQMWTYHAVAAAVRAHSFLASRPEVDRSRIGVTGISWGGYLTCIVAGIDDRVRVAVPVYGCGFLDENSAWVDPVFKKIGPARARRWADLFDPSRYLPGVTCSILFVNGTNDFAYPLDSYKKSYQLVKVPIDLCVTVGMPHGHPEGWAPGDRPLRRWRPQARRAAAAPDRTRSRRRPDLRRLLIGRAIQKAELHFTTGAGPWQDRSWNSLDARIDDSRVSAILPTSRPIVAFFTVQDERGGRHEQPP